MNSSLNNKSVTPSLPANHVGLMLGITAGLSLYALYNTQSGHKFHHWLAKTLKQLNSDLSEPLTSRSDETFQELTNIVDLIKQSPPSTSLTEPPKNILVNLRDHLFAQNQNESVQSTSVSKFAPRHFRQHHHAKSQKSSHQS